MVGRNSTYKQKDCCLPSSTAVRGEQSGMKLRTDHKLLLIHPLEKMRAAGPAGTMMLHIQTEEDATQ